MNRFHLALEVTDLKGSISDYSERLDAEPTLVIEDVYALWRTETLNFSITQSTSGKSAMRHLGWEEEASDSELIGKPHDDKPHNDKRSGMEKDTDVNAILWEKFHFSDQLEEIKKKWPDTDIRALQKKEDSLETRLMQLENLVGKMQGQLPVEQSLAIYEQGIKLAIECEEILESSEQKIDILTDEHGNTAPFNVED